METTIQKWGNSLAVRIPRTVANKLALREGSRVEVHEDTEGIFIRHSAQAHRPLKELVRMIRREQLHVETAWGNARGTEAW